MTSQILSGQVEVGPWIRFLRAHAALTRELSARLEADHGLTLSDFDVLVQLYHAEGHRMRRIDIARSVLLSASGITRLLDGLERAGLVEKQRCESDLRVAYAALTAEGLRKIEEARSTHNADIEELFASKFEPHERETLSELLGRLPLARTAPACESEQP